MPGLTDDVAGGGRKRDDYHETKFPNNFLAAICTRTIFRHFLNVYSCSSKRTAIQICELVLLSPKMETQEISKLPS